MIRAALCIVAFAAVSVAQKPIRFERSSPAVLNLASPKPTLVEVAVAPEVASLDAEVTLAGFTSVRPFRDDGQSGDRRAGDRTFTAQFTAAELIAHYQLTGARHRARSIGLGTLRPRDAAGVILSASAFNLPVRSDAVPTAPVKTAGALQYTPNLVNIAMPRSYFLAQANAGDGDFELDQVTRVFYQHFKDSFDALNIVFAGVIRKNRHFVIASNSIQGIGRPPLSLDAKWGSTSALSGVVVMPIGPLFGVTSDCGMSYVHEHGHRWINFLSGGLHDQNGAHWPLGDMAGGIMGYSAPGNGQGFSGSGLTVPQGNDLKFQPFRDCPQFTDMEMYLMGLRDPIFVASHLVAVDAQQDPGSDGVIHGPFATVTIAQVISQNGSRVPAFPSAQKSFRVATILVTPDSLATQDEMDYYENEALYAGVAFSAATRGVGRMTGEVDTALLAPPPVSPATIHRVRNAASLAVGPLSPGALIRIEGLGLGPSHGTAATLAPGAPGPTSLEGITALLNGAPIALISVQAEAIVAVAPYGLAAPGVAQLQVKRVAGNITTLSNTVSVPIAAVSPGLFAAGGQGNGLADARDAQGNAVSVQNRVGNGDELLIVATGLGPWATPLPEGALVPVGATPPQLANPVQVTVGGKTATVLSATAIPGDISAKAAIRILMPFSPAATGVATRQVAVYVTVGGVTTQNGVRLPLAGPQ